MFSWSRKGSVILYAALLVCAGLAALLVYRYDLHEREPWPWLIATAVAGAALMRGAEYLELAAIGSSGSVLVLAGAAAVAEELLRLLVVVLLAVFFSRTFNDAMDGIVYGSMLGLGMGIEESFSLLAIVSRKGWETLPVELVRLLGHLVMGGITGYGVGMARMRVPGWPRAVVLTVLASIALHFSWDWVALLNPVSPGAMLLQSGAGIVVMLSGILLYGALVVVASERSRQEFAPDSRNTLWSWPFRR